MIVSVRLPAVLPVPSFFFSALVSPSRESEPTSRNVVPGWLPGPVPARLVVDPVDPGPGVHGHGDQPDQQRRQRRWPARRRSGGRDASSSASRRALRRRAAGTAGRRSARRGRSGHAGRSAEVAAGTGRTWPRRRVAALLRRPVAAAEAGHGGAAGRRGGRTAAPGSVRGPTGADGRDRTTSPGRRRGSVPCLRAYPSGVPVGPRRGAPERATSRRPYWREVLARRSSPTRRKAPRV